MSVSWRQIFPFECLGMMWTQAGASSVVSISPVSVGTGGGAGKEKETP